MLEVGEDGWVLDVYEEVDDKKDISIGGEGALVGRVDFSGTISVEMERDKKDEPPFAPDLNCGCGGKQRAKVWIRR